jgi:hypothetical protein
MALTIVILTAIATPLVLWFHLIEGAGARILDEPFVRTKMAAKKTIWHDNAWLF